MGKNSLMKSTRNISSNLATMMFILTTFKQFFPTIIQDYLNSLLSNLIAYFRNEAYVTFYQHKSGRYNSSRAYTAIESYLGSLSNAMSQAKRIRGETSDNRKKSSESLVFTVEDHEVVLDNFERVQFQWFKGKQVSKTNTISYYINPEDRYFRLRYNIKHRDMVMQRYLKHVMDEGEDIQSRRRMRMLYTNNSSSEWKDNKRGFWSKIVFDHPSNFDNLAIDSAKKEEIIEDLMMFSQSRDYYKRIGKAWKRGYLLYGPPGTGKSTLIACMANLLNYDVYDLELTTINTNTELRNLLINTREKAVIVIEDIDCSLSITGKRGGGKNGNKSDESDSDSDSTNVGSSMKKSKTKTVKSSRVTLSGLLNIIDGLWSPCGGERIIVFTTNHIDKLDPALIRTGRMDKHIELSYCTFEAFKVLARNYLSIESHPLFDRIEKLLMEVKITPSDLAECLLPKCKNLDVENRLQIVIQAIEKSKEGNPKQGKSDEEKKLEAEIG